MGFEQRGHGVYFYMKRRQGKKVVSVYGGAGSDADMIFEMEQLRRAAEEEAEQARQPTITQETDGLDEFNDTVNAIVTLAFYAQGYHLHKGQWRKRRACPASSDEGKTEMKEIEALSKTTKVELLQLCAQVRKERPKPADINKLERILDDNPTLYASVVTMAGVLSEKIIGKITGGSKDVAMFHEHELSAMRDGLGFQEATTLEKILIKQICVCWLGVIWAETASVNEQNTSIEVGDYHDRATMRAHAKLRHTVESLARVRRLLQPAAPVYQLNIAPRAPERVIDSPAIETTKSKRLPRKTA